MTDRLKHNLYTKVPLRFGKDGKFRVLMMSDIQETLDYDVRSFAAMDGLIEEHKPDFVMLGGDNASTKRFTVPEEMYAYLEYFASPMEKRGIPWAHVYGNHDHDPPLDDLLQQLEYEKFPHCVSKHTDPDVDGITNFVLPVREQDSDEIALAIWGLDCGTWETHAQLIALHGQTYPKVLPKVRPEPSNNRDVVRFTQQMWYWKSSCELEEYCGRKVPGMMVVHIAPHEMQLIKDNPEELGLKGVAEERLKLGLFNSGLFSTVFQRGDIKVIASGHTHESNMEGEYCGIKMTLDASVGYTCYGRDDTRGGRIFDFNVDGTFETYTVSSAPYITPDIAHGPREQLPYLIEHGGLKI